MTLLRFGPAVAISLVRLEFITIGPAAWGWVSIYLSVHCSALYVDFFLRKIVQKRNPMLGAGRHRMASLCPEHRTYSPDSATSEIGTPCSSAIKPKMEKIAKPATKLVPLFRKQRAMQSLGRRRDEHQPGGPASQ